MGRYIIGSVNKITYMIKIYIICERILHVMLCCPRENCNDAFKLEIISQDCTTDKSVSEMFLGKINAIV